MCDRARARAALSALQYGGDDERYSYVIPALEHDAAERMDDLLSG
jgi:hypothetical protein